MVVKSVAVAVAVVAGIVQCSSIIVRKVMCLCKNGYNKKN